VTPYGTPPRASRSFELWSWPALWRPRAVSRNAKRKKDTYLLPTAPATSPRRLATGQNGRCQMGEQITKAVLRVKDDNEGMYLLAKKARLPTACSRTSSREKCPVRRGHSARDKPGGWATGSLRFNRGASQDPQGEPEGLRSSRCGRARDRQGRFRPALAAGAPRRSGIPAPTTLYQTNMPVRDGGRWDLPGPLRGETRGSA